MSAVPSFTTSSQQARAAVLDRLADQQLQAGFHLQAERLAHAAAAMRKGGSFHTSIPIEPNREAAALDGKTPRALAIA